MTIATWLKRSTLGLQAAGSTSARLDCLILLEMTLGMSRASVLAHDEKIIGDQELVRLETLLARRSRHEPIAYLQGHAEFYGRTFAVSKTVLIPRPESEAIIDLLLAANAKQPTDMIVDIGTGSGALAVSAAAELPGTAVIGSDIDEDCLRLAATNAKTHGVTVRWMRSDLLASVGPLFTQGCTLLANLPYVPDDYKVSPDTAYEPHAALYAGDDGMAAYRRFWLQAGRLPAISRIITESLPEQQAGQIALAEQQGFTCASQTRFVQLYTRLEDDQ